MSTILQLRNLCRDGGIYTLSHLSALAEVEPSVSQEMLAERIGVKRSTIGQIVATLIAQGYVSEAEARIARRSKLSRTESGDALMAQINRLFL